MTTAGDTSIYAEEVCTKSFRQTHLSTTLEEDVKRISAQSLVNCCSE
jgi:hypothetical protein